MKYLSANLGPKSKMASLLETALRPITKDVIINLPLFPDDTRYPIIDFKPKTLSAPDFLHTRQALLPDDNVISTIKLPSDIVPGCMQSFLQTELKTTPSVLTLFLGCGIAMVYDERKNDRHLYHRHITPSFNQRLVDMWRVYRSPEHMVEGPNEKDPSLLEHFLSNSAPDIHSVSYTAMPYMMASGDSKPSVAFHNIFFGESAQLELLTSKVAPVLVTPQHAAFLVELLEVRLHQIQYLSSFFFV